MKRAFKRLLVLGPFVAMVAAQAQDTSAIEFSLPHPPASLQVLSVGSRTIALASDTGVLYSLDAASPKPRSSRLLWPTQNPQSRLWNSVGSMGQAIWVFSAVTGRFYSIAPDALSVTMLPSKLPAWPKPNVLLPRVLTSTGVIVAEELSTSRSALQASAVGRQIVLVSAQGGMDTLTAVRQLDNTLLMSTDRGTFVGSQPWAAPDLFAVSVSGEWMAKVEQHTAETGTHAFIRIWSLVHGLATLVADFKVPRLSIRVTPADVDAHLDARRSTGFFRSFTDSTKAAQAYREALIVPDYRPAVTQVLISDAGILWASRQLSDGAYEWFSIGPGVPICQAVSHLNGRPTFFVHNTLWTTVSDGDNAKVSMYRLPCSQVAPG